jgi:hypothetical protein
MKSYPLIFFLFVSMLLWSGCGDSKKEKQQEMLAALDSMNSGGPAIADEAIRNIIASIPSPLEISFLIKDAGGKYNKEMLNSTENISKYNTNFKRAFNLGIYGTDLGYANIYNQNQDALFYLNGVRDLADQLNIGQFFDFQTIKKLATSANNLDSLLLTTTTNFERINLSLQEQKRANLSILILTGGWLEALHITCQVSKISDNEKLKERIGEQKIILSQILKLLEYYQKDANFVQLNKDLAELNGHFEKVNISYINEEPTVEEVDGILMVVNKTRSVVEISPETLEAIANKTLEIRNKVTS